MAKQFDGINIGFGSIKWMGEQNCLSMLREDLCLVDFVTNNESGC